MRSPSPGSLYARGRPYTSSRGGGLFAVGADMAKLLAVVTLRKVVFGFILLYLDGNMAEAGQFENI
jgi:hypothetical protein